MDGSNPSSMNSATRKAPRSQSSSRRLPESSADSLCRVGIHNYNGKKMRRRSFTRSIDSKFTESFILNRLYVVVRVGALALEEAH